MDFFLDGLAEAARLVGRGDREVLHAIFVTLFCTTTAVSLASLVAFPLGAWLGVHRRDGRGLRPSRARKPEGRSCGSFPRVFPQGPVVGTCLGSLRP